MDVFEPFEVDGRIKEQEEFHQTEVMPFIKRNSVDKKKNQMRNLVTAEKKFFKQTFLFKFLKTTIFTFIILSIVLLVFISIIICLDLLLNPQSYNPSYCPHPIPAKLSSLEFVHIPKTAGTSIQDSFYKQFGIHWGIRSWELSGYVFQTPLFLHHRLEWKTTLRYYAISIRNLFFQKITAPDHTPEIYTNPCKINFCVIREPFGWFVSLFQETLVFAHTFQHFPSEKVLKSCDINDFVQEYQKSWNPLLGFQKKQTEYLPYCHRILKFEDLNNEMEKLGNEFGFQIDLLHSRIGKERRYCEVGIQNMTIESKDWFEKEYKEDFIFYKTLSNSYEK